MRLGMLWFDNSKDATNVKIEKALKYYLEKYKKPANTVWIHPFTPECTPILNVQVKTSTHIIPNHFWIGTE